MSQALLEHHLQHNPSLRQSLSLYRRFTWHNNDMSQVAMREIAWPERFMLLGHAKRTDYDSTKFDGHWTEYTHKHGPRVLPSVLATFSAPYSRRKRYPEVEAPQFPESLAELDAFAVELELSDGTIFVWKRGEAELLGDPDRQLLVIQPINPRRPMFIVGGGEMKIKVSGIRG